MRGIPPHFAVEAQNLTQSSMATNRPYIAIPSARATKIRLRVSISGFSLAAPMAAEPLEWGSRDLAALTEYMNEVQQEYIDRE